MSSEDTKKLGFNLDKTLFLIYAVLESLIEKIDECKINPENSSTAKLGEHIPPGFSMFTIL